MNLHKFCAYCGLLFFNKRNNPKKIYCSQKCLEQGLSYNKKSERRLENGKRTKI